VVVTVNCLRVTILNPSLTPRCCFFFRVFIFQLSNLFTCVSLFYLLCSNWSSLFEFQTCSFCLSCFSIFSCLICLHAFHYFICCFLNGLHYLNFKRLKVRGLMFERLAVFMLNVCNFDRLNVWTSDSLQFERLSLERLDIWLLNDWRCGGWRLNAWIYESLKFEWLKHRSSTLERLTDWRLSPWHFEHLKFQVLCVWALERLELRQFEVWTFECLNVWTFNVWSLNLCWLNL